MDKVSSVADVVGELRDGMTLGIGGWGSRRKPMALVEAIGRSSLRDLTVVAYGGPDVGLLCALGKVRRLVYGFVSLDSIPLEPNFRRAREAGAIEPCELDEGMLQLGLRAAAWNVDFLPTRAGLGSDVLSVNPDLRLVDSPYSEARYVAVPALRLDAALVHVHRADRRGNTALLGPDPYFDPWFCLAAQRRYVSCERLVDTAELAAEGGLRSLLLHRGMVDRVVEAPGGAGFTECLPDYPRDEAAQRAYADASRTPEGFAAWWASRGET